MPALTSLNGKISWAIAGGAASSGRKIHRRRDKRFIRKRIIAQRRMTARQSARRIRSASHPRGLGNSHQTEGVPHLGQKKVREHHARLLEAGVGLLHHGILVVAGVEPLRQRERVLDYL